MVLSSSSLCGLSSRRCLFHERLPCLLILCSIIGSCQANVKWIGVGQFVKVGVTFHQVSENQSTVMLDILISQLMSDTIGNFVFQLDDALVHVAFNTVTSKCVDV